MRTRIEGVLHYLRNNFEGFFNYVSVEPVPGAPVVVYKDHLHSFWHDDVPNASVQEKYRRRIARFNNLCAAGEKVLFVRSGAHTKELALIDELLQELVKRFGKQVKLLAIADFQAKTVGPAFVEDRPNLLVYFLPTDAHRDPDGAPYPEAISCAVDWIEGRHVEAMRIPSVHRLLDFADFPKAYSTPNLTPLSQKCPRQPAVLPPAAA